MDGRPVDSLIGHRLRGKGTLGGVTNTVDQIYGVVAADVDGSPGLT